MMLGPLVEGHDIKNNMRKCKIKQSRRHLYLFISVIKDCRQLPRFLECLAIQMKPLFPWVATWQLQSTGSNFFKLLSKFLNFQIIITILGIHISTGI